MSRMSRDSSRVASHEVGDLIEGPARVEGSLRALLRRVRPGDVAVIDVMDLDARSAEALAARRPACVINAQRTLSGRFPAGGAKVLLDAGVVLVDEAGGAILGVKDGARIAIDAEGVVTRAGTEVASGVRLTESDVDAATAAATEGMHVQLASFAANAMDLVEHEAPLLLEGHGLPDAVLEVEGRPVVVVAPGYRHERRLKELRPFLRDHRPAIIAVGEAAQAVLDGAYPATLVVGDVEALSERALTKAGHVLLHDPAGGEAGASRVDALGVAHSAVTSTLASEDLAILLAHAAGASAVVTIGVPATLTELLESGSSQGRNGEGAGTFLARLQAGSRIVDSGVLARLYRQRYPWWVLVALLASALLALGVAIWVTPGGQSWIEGAWQSLVGAIGVDA